MVVFPLYRKMPPLPFDWGALALREEPRKFAHYLIPFDFVRIQCPIKVRLLVHCAQLARSRYMLEIRAACRIVSRLCDIGKAAGIDPDLFNADPDMAPAIGNL